MDFDMKSRHIVFARDELKVCGSCPYKRKNVGPMHSTITTYCLTCSKPDVVTDAMIHAWSQNPTYFITKFNEIRRQV